MSLSVVINAKNMATTLGQTLKSVEGFADEIVLVDMKSTDDTVVVAKKFGAKVFAYDQNLGFADPARNFALSKATSEWILVLDADEEVTPELKKLLVEIIGGKSADIQHADAYNIPRKNLIFGKWIEKTGWWPDYQLRFFKTGTVSWTNKVHTAPVVTGKVVDLPADEIIAIIHHNYQSISQFVERMNRYTEIQSDTKHLEDSTPVTAAQVVHTFSAELLRRLFFQEGIDEGTHGVSLSFLQTMYELVAELKRWEKQGFSVGETKPEQTLKELRDLQKHLNYWIADWQIAHTTGFSQMWWKFRRKYSI